LLEKFLTEKDINMIIRRALTQLKTTCDVLTRNPVGMVKIKLQDVFRDRINLWRLKARYRRNQLSIFFYECDMLRRRCCISSYLLTNPNEFALYLRIWGFPNKPNYMFKMFDYIHSVMWPSQYGFR